jgi:hypothetical protein
MPDKKEYTLKINGVEEAIKNFTLLDEAVKAFDATMRGATEQTTRAAAADRGRKQSLTEEEKAAKKLEDTQRRMEAVQKGLTDEQVRANQALREATREQQARIRAENAASDSIEGMRLEMGRLKNEWKGVAVGSEQFQELTQRIRELNDRIKEAEQSTGDFRRNVGNYQSALDGLDKLHGRIDGVSKSSMGLAQGLMSANMLMTMFGNDNEETAKQTANLQKVIAFLSVAQQVNNNLVKDGIVRTSIQTAQTRARAAAETAATRSTAAATVAQRIFNAVAAANPYVLLALALVAVGGALFAFSSKTKGAADEQKKLNDLQSHHLDILEEESAKLREVSDERIAGTERQLRVLKATGASMDDIQEKEREILAERRRGNAHRRSFHNEELKDLDKNKAKLVELRGLLRKLQQDKIDGKNKVPLEINGKTTKLKIDKAIDLIQAQIDNVGRSVQIAVELKADTDELEAVEAEQNARQKKERKEKAKNRAATELAAVRAAEDARIKLIKGSDDRTRETLEKSYDRQIEDIKKRLTAEKGLTIKARAALNDAIFSLEAQKGRDLENLKKEQAERAVALQQEVEDSRLAVIIGEYDRQVTEINIRYDRQIAAYKKRGEEEKNLTREQQREITELIVNAQTARGNALARITADQLNRQADQQLALIENTLNGVKGKIGTILVRDREGLQLIDLEATRENLSATNAALDEFIRGVKGYEEALVLAHELALEGLKEGSTEYEAEMRRYTGATQAAAKLVKDAEKEKAENVKASTRLIGEYLEDVIAKVNEYAGGVSSLVMDTLNKGLQTQLDELNAQMDALSERYDEAQKQREDAVKNVEKIEAQLQGATGGTAEALKEQLQDAMHARADADREEQRLANEKAKREAEIAKKEKQLRRSELISGIAQSIANTAQGVTAALKLGLPGLVIAAIVGALGGVQVGIMTKQLAKLADGGELKGPSHGRGGMRIHGTNIEVEGGEYVVNKYSTSKNKGLLTYINSQRRELTMGDLSGFLNRAKPLHIPIGRTVLADGGQIPAMQPAPIAGIDYRLLAEAAARIQIRPVVSVTDIDDVSRNLTAVKDLAGF